MNQTAMNTLEYPEIIRMLSERALSEPGRRLCEALLPETDRQIVIRRLHETSEARAVSDKGGVPLSALTGVDRVLEKLGKTMNLNPEELTMIRDMNRNVVRMMHFMRDREMLAPTLSTYAASMDPLAALSEEIERCILDNRVDDRASSELARLRKKIAILTERIHQKLNALMNAPGMRDVLQDQGVSMRGNRYVIPVKRSHRQKLDGDVLDISSTGATVFVEPTAIRSMKTELDILVLDEEREVYRILATLTAMAAGHLRALHINLQTMANYDFLFARAKLANSMRARCPEITADRKSRIVEGRHPLIGEEAVPLNFHIGEGFRALVITGPNTGGKTVSLKTVGLFSLMAQAGLHIPCGPGTRLPLYADILADIGDGQSIAQSLSTFSSHIRNIIAILTCAGPNTLAIVDELGTGTDPGEGMGLAISVMEALWNKGATLIATTHYSEIKDFASRHPGFRNGSMSFDIATLMPKYELSIGTPGESHAFLIALRLGMDPNVVARARHFTANGAGAALMPETTPRDMSPHQSESSLDVSRLAESTLAESTLAESALAESHVGESTLAESRLSSLLENASHSQMTPVAPVVAEEVLQSHQNGERREKDRKRAQTQLVFEKRRNDSPFRLGDCVFVNAMNRTGIVCETENTRGEIGVMVQHKKIMVDHKRIRPFLEGKDLYPEDYNLDTIFESKQNRKARKLMGKRHVEGLQIVVEKGRNHE